MHMERFFSNFILRLLQCFLFPAHAHIFCAGTACFWQEIKLENKDLLRHLYHFDKYWFKIENKLPELDINQLSIDELNWIVFYCHNQHWWFNYFFQRSQWLFDVNYLSQIHGDLQEINNQKNENNLKNERQTKI